MALAKSLDKRYNNKTHCSRLCKCFIYIYFDLFPNLYIFTTLVWNVSRHTFLWTKPILQITSNCWRAISKCGKSHFVEKKLCQELRPASKLQVVQHLLDSLLKRIQLFGNLSTCQDLFRKLPRSIQKLPRSIQSLKSQVEFNLEDPF